MAEYDWKRRGRFVASRDQRFPRSGKGQIMRYKRCGFFFGYEQHGNFLTSR
jgi:hypothetical protein